MKKLLLVLTFLFPFCAYAKDIIIDERITDVYFANGVSNTKDDARESSDLIYKVALKDLYNSDELAMDKEARYKLLYNYTYGSVLGHLFDILEEFTPNQIDDKYFWIAYEVGLKAVCNKVQDGSWKKFAKDTIIGFIVDNIVDPVQEMLGITFLDDLIDIIAGFFVTKDPCDVILSAAGLTLGIVHDIDFKSQIADMRESVRSGHHAIIVAHSQGNLFAKAGASL
ncbi:MAG: hypothetical protein LBO72_04940 [Helicobacteraceae bacterium]|nr:hypothetical protein [Helicobacteraceae bacterium]